MNYELIENFIDRLSIINEYSYEISTALLEMDIKVLSALKSIYVKRRRTETELLKGFEPGRQCVFFYGPRGSGKTSVLYNLYLNDRIPNDYGTILVDFYREYVGKQFQAENKAYGLEEAARSVIIRKIINSFFPADDQDKRIELYAHILHPNRQRQYLNNPFQNLWRLSERLYNIFRLDNLDKADLSFNDWVEWLKEYYVNKEVQDIFRDADDIIDVSHVVVAAILTNPFDNLLIILDNVDQLELDEQSKISHFIRNVSDSVRVRVTFCVAIRDINVLHIENDDTQVGFLRSNKVGINRGEKFPSVWIDPLDASTFKQICEKRLEYIRADIGIEPDSDDYIRIVEISEKLFKFPELSSNAIPDLLNHSIKNCLILQYQWLDFIFKNNKEIYFINHLDSREWPWLTFFYKFISIHRKDHNLRIYDICDCYINWLQRDCSPLWGCHLDHLAITAIMNLCLDNKNVHGTSVTDVESVIRRLNYLGYSKSDIKRTIYNLHKFEGGWRGNQILFSTNNRVNSVNAILDKDEIIPAPQAKILVTEFTNKVGYIIGSLENCVQCYPNAAFTRSGNDRKDITGFLSKIGAMHIKTIKYFSENCVKDGIFSNNYKRRFGVPIEVGDTIKKLFYFEAILESCLRYYRKPTEFIAELQQFREDWNRLIDVIDHNPSKFDEAFKLSRFSGE